MMVLDTDSMRPDARLQVGVTEWQHMMAPFKKD